MAKYVKMLKAACATILLILITSGLSYGQAEMADTMRTNGKIYVVVVVLATIFAGIFGYLVYIDRKISRIEKEK